MTILGNKTLMNDNIVSPDMSKEVIINHALKLLNYTSWSDFKMSLLAQEVGISPLTLYSFISDKTDLLISIVQEIDAISKKSYETIQYPLIINAHDKLFDIIMCRLEAMQPYKKAFQNITYEVLNTPFECFQSLPEIVRSRKKMLEMASISTNNILGMIKIKAFAIVFTIILKEWLKEETFEPSDMMIEIDKRLKQIASILKIS